MKKKFLSLAIVALCGTAITLNAQKPAADNSDKQQCAKDKKECRHDKKMDKKGCPNPFEGITLTQEQQAKLDQLNQSRKADRQQRAQATKEQKKQAKEARRADRKAQKRDYLNNVKSILTPDQYVVFLENIVVEQAPGQHKMMRANDGKVKGMKKFDKKGNADKQRTDKKDKKDKK